MTDEHVAENNTAPAVPVQRLCNEIQLFDLCDLERCSFKVGKFCTNAELLAAFERISDAEVARSDVFVSEGLEDGEEVGDDEYDDEYDSEFEDDAEYDE